jgi:hypothetical protein
VQEEERRLRGDRHANLIAHDEAWPALEMFLLEEDAGVAEQLLLVGGGQPREHGHAAFDDPLPVFRKGFRAPSLAAAGFSSEDHVDV